MLIAHNITKAFGDQVVLNEACGVFEQGKMYFIEAASGEGKTTFMGILSGLMKPDSGEIKYGDINLYDLSDSDLDKFRLEYCSYIFQTPNLFPALTVLQNLEVFLRWGGVKSHKERIDRATAILTELGLGHRLHIRPAQLSGGERQRVAIARAMVKNPKFLFADEPTSALDFNRAKSVIELLKDQTKKGVCVVIITHDKRLNNYADKIYGIYEGKLFLA